MSVQAAHEMSTAVAEEALVVALDRLGVSYLTRQPMVAGTPLSAQPDPQALIAALIQHPRARLRAAVISLLLANPEMWRAVDSARTTLPKDLQQLLDLFYTAASLLQREHASEITERLGPNWERLPPLYQRDLELLGGYPVDSLDALAQLHQEVSGSQLNWEGSYRQTAQHLLRQWAGELRWNP